MAKMGRASSPPTPINEKAVRPPTAVSASIPAVSSMRNWTAAPAAAPPGTMREMALPASSEVTTENHGEVRNGEALQRERAREVGHLGPEGHHEPDEVQGRQPGPRCDHGGDARQDEVDGDPDTTTTTARLATAFTERGCAPAR